MAMMVNARGSPTMVCYIGADLVIVSGAKPRVNLHLTRDGYAGWKGVYDKNNRLVEESWYGVREEPVLTRAGYARVTRTWNESGAMTAQTWWGLDGRLDYLPCRQKRDKSGRVVEEWYVTPAGKPALHLQGFHRWTARFDEMGREVGRAFFGVDGRPTRTRLGFSSFTRRYDEHNRPVEEAFFDEAGRPTRHNKKGHRWTVRFDDRGRMVEMSGWDTEGRPDCHEPEGRARLRWTFDSRGGAHEWNEAPGADGQWLHSVRRSPEPKVWETAWMTAAGQPALHRDGFHKAVVRLGLDNVPVEVAYFGLDGKPARHADGFHRLTRRFDDNGHLLEENWFGADGRPARHKDGHARVLRGLTFDSQGKPAVNRFGHHEWRERYDEAGRRFELACFGLYGEPAPHSDGYHKESVVYDKQGRYLEVAYFGVDGKPFLFRGDFARKTYRYDEEGREIEQSCFGTDNKFRLNKAGFARLTRRYSPDGKLLRENWFGVDGQPVLTADGFSSWRARYNDKGQLVEKSWYGPDGKLTVWKAGYARWLGTYDAKGRLTESSWFGAGEKPILLPPQVTRLSLDAIRAEDHIDLKTARMSDGHHKVVSVFDDQGNLIEHGWFGTDGKPMVRPSIGAARIVFTFEKRRRVADAYFGMDGKPVRNLDGYHRRTTRFDATGREQEHSYFDVDGKPMAGKSPARRVNVYSGKQLVDTVCYSADGKRLRQEVVIALVQPGSQASRLGLRIGDVLVEYDGRDVTSITRLNQQRLEERAGQPARPLKVRRGNKTFTVSVVFGAFGATVTERIVADAGKTPR
jgi:hypothetical protein